MIRWAGAKILKRRGQAMAELAICGSLMLLALALLVRYGMSYTANQKLGMTVFRQTVNNAYKYDSGQEQWYKDADIADPQDMFGFGSRQVLSAGAMVTWSNTSFTGKVPDDDDSLIIKIIRQILTYFGWLSGGASDPPVPVINYTFISGESGQQVRKEYTIAAYKTVSPSSVDVYYSFLPNVVTIPAGNMKEDPDTKLLKVLVTENGGGPATCTEHYCPTDVLTMADVDGDTHQEEIVSVAGTAVKVLDFQDGQIDQSKLGGSMSDYQGVEPTQDMSVHRADTLTVNDNGGYVSSSSARSESVGITYHIRTNGGREDVTIGSGTHGGWSTGGAK